MSTIPVKISILLLGLFLGLSGTVLAQGGGKGGQPATAAPVADLPVCGSLPGGIEIYDCQCPDGFSHGPVWGSGPYTADSNLCTAALHAGVIGANGGAAKFVRLPGQSSYDASSRNGVDSSSWSSYGESFGAFAADAVVSITETRISKCGKLPSGTDDYSCVCLGSQSGSVWGSGPYTADSDICTAARHAGALGAEDGEVRVLRILGLENYRASDTNGVQTSGWGAYSSSIVFNTNH